MSHQYPPPNQPPYGAYGQQPHGAPPQGYQQPPYPQQQYGAPQGAPQGQYPPQQGYGHPPPQQGAYYGAPSPQPHGYHAPSPQPPAGYHAPSPQPPYGAPPNQAPYGQPPQGYGAPPNQPPPGGPGYGAPYGAPPMGQPPMGQPPMGQPPMGQPPMGQPPMGQPPMGQPQGGMPPYMGAPSVPSLGYVLGQTAPGDFRPQADALRKAMKGFGTDEKALIQTLAHLDPLQMAAVRATYSSHIGRDLYKDVKSECGGYLRDGLLAVIEGPLMHDTACAHEAIQGIGTKEWLMNDILLGRSNADLTAIKAAYERTYRRPLTKDVEGDLSFKTASLFATVLSAQRHDESIPPNPHAMENEARMLHDATSARMVNNVTEVCAIFARSSDNEIRAIDQAFHARYHSSLEKHIEKEFAGHMEDALLHMLRTAKDPAMRDAILLEECMSGMGTKDDRLVVRVVRVHWNRNHKEQVKRAYHHKYGKHLIERVRGETSGDYQRLMVALLE